MAEPQRITEEELEKALRSTAILIQNYGLKYWPIFERMDEELKQLRARRQRLTAALDL